jgi:hypothetical protein
MSFGKAVQNTNSDALAEFALAQMKYKKACSVFTRVRFELIGSESSDAAIIRHHRAKIVFKQECKDYAAARARYINTIRLAATQLPTLSNRDLYSLTVETTQEAINTAIREDAISRTITQEEIEMVKRVTAERQRVKDSFLSHNESPDISEDGKIQFDPEFDKL